MTLVACCHGAVECGGDSTLDSTAMKTIQMTIDADLLRAVDRVTRARRTSRSAFIRDALVAELRREQVAEAERRHAAGYERQPVLAGEFDLWTTEQDWGAR